MKWQRSLTPQLAVKPLVRARTAITQTLEAGYCWIAWEGKSEAAEERVLDDVTLELTSQIIVDAGVFCSIGASVAVIR